MDLSPIFGLWLGFVLSLMAVSMIIRDNLLSRLAQYILVGSATGYLMVLVIQEILRPKLFEPLLTAGPIAFDLLVPLILGLGLLFAGLDGTIRQSRIADGSDPSRTASQSSSSASKPLSWFGGLYAIALGIGRIAIIVIVGVGIANAIAGTVQGTLIPQFWQATRLQSDSGLVQSAINATTDTSALGALVALIITIGTILHLYVVPHRSERSTKVDAYKDRHSLTEDSNPNPVSAEAETRPGRGTEALTNNVLLRGWAAVGKRALWFAAGVLFARLAASRLSLLIARIDYFIDILETTTIWQQVIRLIEPFFG